MMVRLTAKYYTYLLIWAVCIALAAISRSPEPLFAAAPFFIALISGLIPRSAPNVTVAHRTGDSHVFENDPVQAGFTLSARTVVPLIEAVDVLPRDARLLNGSNTVVTCLTAGSTSEFDFQFSYPSRRTLDGGELILRMRDRAGFVSWEQRIPHERGRVVYPAPEIISRLPQPGRTRVFAGNYPSEIKGEGIEFSDVRQFLPGDRMSRFNWRAYARTGIPYVNDFVTERNTDVVMLVDVFANAGLPGTSVLDAAARGAATIAHHYIRDKNRVGLVELGYYLKYLLPGPGRRQWYRILSMLSEMRCVERYVTYEVNHIPPKILPAQALVVAFTGLMGDLFAQALVDLKSRGFDVAVVYISPVDLLVRELGADRGTDSFSTVASPASPSLPPALMLWRLNEERRIRSLRETGLFIAQWNTDEPFDQVVRNLSVTRTARRRSS